MNKKMEEKNNELMNISDAANYLNYKVGYVYKLTSERKIPFYKPTGRHILFRRTELDEWVNRTRVVTRKEQREAAL